MKKEVYIAKKDHSVVSDKNTRLSDEQTELSIKRTAMAANQTLQGWIRTSLSMISFGFTIYKVLLSINERTTMTREIQPRNFGLFLIFLGTTSMVVGIIEYFQTLKRLNELSKRRYREIGSRLYVVVAMTLAGLGAFLFISILINREFF